jgi:hypothetical protein
VEETGKQEAKWQNDLDGLADIHARLNVCESVDIALARRVAVLEEKNRGHYDGDDPFKQIMGHNPLSGLTPLLWIGAILTLAPMVLELWQQWRSLPSSQS